MGVVVGGVSPRTGVGLTTFLLALAWDAADKKRCLYIEADPKGGTVKDALSLKLGDGGRQVGMRQLVGLPRITPAAVMAATAHVEKRPNLWVVPGYHNESGMQVQRFLARLKDGGDLGAGMSAQGGQSTLEALNFDLVVVDLGSPWVYEDAPDPQQTTAAIVDTFARILVLMRDSADLISHNLGTLGDARLPRGEVVLSCQPSGRKEMRRRLTQFLDEAAPQLRVAPVDWQWRNDDWLRAVTGARAMDASGMAKKLGLVPG